MISYNPFTSHATTKESPFNLLHVSYVYLCMHINWSSINICSV